MTLTTASSRESWADYPAPPFWQRKGPYDEKREVSVSFADGTKAVFSVYCDKRRPVNWGAAARAAFNYWDNYVAASKLNAPVITIMRCGSLVCEEKSIVR